MSLYNDLMSVLTPYAKKINSTIPAFSDLVAPVESGQLCYYNKEVYRRVDKSSTAPSTFEAVNWKKTTLADEQVANERMKRNIWYALNGGTARIVLEQGAYTTTNGMEIPTLNNNSVKYCRTRYDMSPYIFKGDTVSIATDYQFLIIPVEYTDAGLAKISDVDLGGYKSEDFTIPFSGFFVIIVKNDSSTAITPAEAEQALTITYEGACKNLESEVSDINTSVTDIQSDIADTFPNIASAGKAGKLIWNDKNLLRSVDGYSSTPGSISDVIWKDTTVSDEFEAKALWMENFYNAINGGKNTIAFEQGSASNSGGHLVPSDRTNFVRTRFDCPPFLFNGDEIVIEDGFEVLVTKVDIDNDGLIPVYNIDGWSGVSPKVISKDGLYFIYARRVEVGGVRADLTPEEAKSAVTIKHNGVTLNREFKLKRNPYKNIQWTGNPEKPLKPYVKDVTSASHVHCETQEEFDALKTKYDHIALSNYYPSSPYYPLTAFFSNVGNVLSSPNSEHAYFSDSPRTGCHFNALGSYLSRATVKVADGGWGGTIKDFINAANESMKLSSGGGITVNHPSWSGLTAADIIKMLDYGEGIIALEVWNAGCERDNSKGDSTTIWDAVLATGRQIYAVATPDHEIQYHSDAETYGYGYNHMLVTNITEDEILNAYKLGKFYCTKFNDGLALSSFDMNNAGLVSIEVSESSTILFKTATRTSQLTSTTSGTFQTQDGDIYVRVEVTRGNNKLWTNAIML